MLRAKHAGRPYTRPICSTRSVDDVATRLRKLAPGTAESGGAESTAKIMAPPVLLIEGYHGGANELAGALESIAAATSRCAAATDQNLFEISLSDERFPKSERLLVIDLRQRQLSEWRLQTLGTLLESSRTSVVILVTSAEEFSGLGRLRATHCWQIQGVSNASHVIGTLATVLKICRDWNASRDDEFASPATTLKRW